MPEGKSESTSENKWAVVQTETADTLADNQAPEFLAELTDTTGAKWAVHWTKSGLSIDSSAEGAGSTFISGWEINPTVHGIIITATAGRYRNEKPGSTWKLESLNHPNLMWEITPTKLGLTVASNDRWDMNLGGLGAVSPGPPNFTTNVPYKESAPRMRWYANEGPNPAPTYGVLPRSAYRFWGQPHPYPNRRRWPAITAYTGGMVVRFGRPNPRPHARWVNFFESEIPISTFRMPAKSSTPYREQNGELNELKDQDGVLNPIKKAYEPYLNDLVLCWDATRNKSYQTYNLDMVQPKCWPRMFDVNPFLGFGPPFPAFGETETHGGIPGEVEVRDVNKNMIFNSLRGHSIKFMEHWNHKKKGDEDDSDDEEKKPKARP